MGTEMEQLQTCQKCLNSCRCPIDIIIKSSHTTFITQYFYLLFLGLRHNMKYNTQRRTPFFRQRFPDYDQMEGNDNHSEQRNFTTNGNFQQSRSFNEHNRRSTSLDYRNQDVPLLLRVAGRRSALDPHEDNRQWSRRYSTVFLLESSVLAIKCSPQESEKRHRLECTPVFRIKCFIE